MRKALKIFGILFILYTLTGFFILPLSIQFFGQRALQKEFGDSAQLQKVTANPFTWKLAIEGLKLQDPADQWALQIKQASVDLSAATLVQFHPVLDAVLVDTPDIHYVRRITEPMETVEAEIEEEVAGDWREALTQINSLEIPKIQIDLLKVENGILNFSDEANDEAYAEVISPINLELYDFSTATADEDVIRFSAQTEQGTDLSFEARFTSNPITCSGTIALSGFDVSKLAPYYKQYINFDLASAVFGIRFDYRIDLSDLDHLLLLSAGQIELNEILCRPLSGENRLISLNSVRLDGIQFEFPQQNLQIDKITLQDGQTLVARSADGSINLLRLIASDADALESSAEAEVLEVDVEAVADDDSTLTYQIDQIEIVDYQVAWADELNSGDATVTVDISHFSIQGTSSDLSAPITIAADYGFGSTGTAHIEGSMIPATAQLDLDLTIAAFPLSMVAPYAQEFGQLSLEDGTVDFTGKLQSQPEDRMRVTGAIQISDFAMTTTVPNDLQASWQALSISGLEVTTNPLVVRADQFDLNTPKTLLRLAPTDSAQVDNLDSAQLIDNAAPEVESTPLDLVLNEFRIRSGGFILIDENVQPAGKFNVEETELSLLNVSLNSSEATEVDLKAKVNQSRLSVTGQLYPANPKQDSELQIQMTGLALPAFSSYTGKAVGRKVKNGIFNLNADWKVKDSQLKASNKILIDQMSFGEKVDSDTAISLPLDLAVTLLKGTNGQMDLSLPLSGDLSDPKASIWQIVRTAAVGLITNVATAPFKLLSNLVGSEADLSQVAFDPNSSQLTADTIDRLNAISKALKARPQILLSITPTLSDQDDVELAKAVLRTKLMANSKDTSAEAYQQRIAKAYEDQQKVSQQPSSDEPISIEQMEAILIENLQVPEATRQQLAEARATEVQRYFITTSEIDPSRLSVEVLDPEVHSASVQFELK
jgi:flagellar motor protein MotB